MIFRALIERQKGNVCDEPELLVGTEILNLWYYDNDGTYYEILPYADSIDVDDLVAATYYTSCTLANGLVISHQISMTSADYIKWEVNGLPVGREGQLYIWIEESGYTSYENYIPHYGFDLGNDNSVTHNQDFVIQLQANPSGLYACSFMAYRNPTVANQVHLINGNSKADKVDQYVVDGTPVTTIDSYGNANVTEASNGIDITQDSTSCTGTGNGSVIGWTHRSLWVDDARVSGVSFDTNPLFDNYIDNTYDCKTLSIASWGIETLNYAISYYSSGWVSETTGAYKPPETYYAGATLARPNEVYRVVITWTDEDGAQSETYYVFSDCEQVTFLGNAGLSGKPGQYNNSQVFCCCNEETCINKDYYKLNTGYILLILGGMFKWKISQLDDGSTEMLSLTESYNTIGDNIRKYIKSCGDSCFNNINISNTCF